MVLILGRGDLALPHSVACAGSPRQLPGSEFSARAAVGRAARRCRRPVPASCQGSRASTWLEQAGRIGLLTPTVAENLNARYTHVVHVISRKALRRFWERHPDSQEALVRWFRIVSKTEFASFAELRRAFPSADQVGRLTVFNIGGGKYRLIASIHYNRRKVYIRHVLTHHDYDRGAWRE